jgi:transposase
MVLGGRPRVPHRVVVRVLWFVLATGNRWDTPHGSGLGKTRWVVERTVG